MPTVMLGPADHYAEHAPLAGCSVLLPLSKRDPRVPNGAEMLRSPAKADSMRLVLLTSRLLLTFAGDHRGDRRCNHTQESRWRGAI